MQFEYLIFNIIVFSGPFFLGLLKPFYFVDRWSNTMIATVIVAIPYLIWDSLVTGTHWSFNPMYILGIKIARLPLEEILFFITVPFACIYTWEMIIRRNPATRIEKLNVIKYLPYVLPLAGIWLFINGLQYTGLVFLFLAIAIGLDHLLNTNLFLQKRFYLFMGFIILFTLIFNGYLTWRPVVLYGEAYQVGFRIFTIPIEDFGYGISLLYMCTAIYDKLRTRKESLLARS